jgi:hypothetical protein
MTNANDRVDIPHRTSQQLVRQDSHRVPEGKQRVIRKYRPDCFLFFHFTLSFLSLAYRLCFEIRTLHDTFEGQATQRSMPVQDLYSFSDQDVPQEREIGEILRKGGIGCDG